MFIWIKRVSSIVIMNEDMPAGRVLYRIQLPAFVETAQAQLGTTFDMFINQNIRKPEEVSFSYWH